MDPVEPWIDADAVRRMAAQLLTRTETPELGERPDAGFGPGFEGFVEAASAERARPAAPPPEVAQVPEKREAPAAPAAPETAAAISGDAPADARPQPAAGPDTRPEEAPRRSGPPPLPASRPAPEAERSATPAAEPAPSSPPVEPEAEPEGEPAGREAGIPEAEESPFRRVEAAPAGRPPAADPGSERLLERLEDFRDSLCRHAQAKGVFILDREGEPILDDPTFGKLHFLARSLAQAYRPVEGRAGNVHVKVGAEAFLVVIPVETRAGCMVLGTVLRQPLDAAAVEVVSKALVKVVDS